MQPKTDAIGETKTAQAGLNELNGEHEHLNGNAPLLHELLHALQAMRVGDFSVRMAGDQVGIAGKIADTFNEIVAANQRMAQQLERVGKVVGREGKTRQRVRFALSNGAWGEMETSVNTLIDDLLWPTMEVTRAIAAVAQGDLLQTVRLDVDGRPLKGEFLQSATIVNAMIKQLGAFASEATRVAREVDHRARNALAVVQSIVRLTRAKSVDDYVGALEGRIGALSRAHILLSKSRWEGADLGRLVEEEMAPYRVGEGERILMSGPPVVLQPATAQTLALALHELATNAAKYGALSAITGQVGVTWQVADGMLSLEWNETGGPHTVKPSIQGYGTRVIAASIERQLGGRAVFDWRPQGLNFTLSVPQGEDVEDEDAAAIKHDVAKERTTTVNGVSKRILLVEDEAIVAMMMADMLGDLRFAVLGPINRLAPATAAARDDDIDAAILDVNLAGENVYPVAEILERRGVPYVFVTGYGMECIDRRFAHVPVIQKPVERPVLENIFAGVLNGPAQRGTKCGKATENLRAAALAGSSESAA
jgi:two-component sensor histidine kinase